MAVREDLRRALTEAMRARDTAVISPLRSAVAAIDNAEAVAGVATPSPDSPIAGAVAGVGAADVARVTLSNDLQLAILSQEISDLSAHVERLTRLCRLDEADAARRALVILNDVSQANTERQ